MTQIFHDSLLLFSTTLAKISFFSSFEEIRIFSPVTLTKVASFHDISKKIFCAHSFGRKKKSQKNLMPESF